MVGVHIFVHIFGQPHGLNDEEIRAMGRPQRENLLHQSEGNESCPSVPYFVNNPALYRSYVSLTASKVMIFVVKSASHTLRLTEEF